MPGLYTTGYKLFYKDMGPWNSSTNYNPGETVTYNFTTYLCIGQVVNLPAQTPDAATTFWVTITNPSVTSDLGDRFLISATSARGRTIDGLIEKEYLINYYSNLLPSFTQSGIFSTGRNDSGELGTNDTTNRTSLVPITSNGNNWASIQASYTPNGGFQGLQVGIKTDGTLWTWGGNTYGQLGDNTATNKSSPVQTVAGGFNWKQAAPGGDFCCAIKTDGTLWTWGRNNYGQLGDGTNGTSRSSPVQILGGGTNWKQVDGYLNRAGAVKLDGSLWMWGRGQYGELGDNGWGSIYAMSSPVQTIATGNDWMQIAVGEATLAIKSNNSLWAWGGFPLHRGDNGAFAGSSVSSPIQTVTNNNSWKTVDIMSTAVAIKTDGTLWTWGSNTNGQLGDNTTTDKSSPVQTILGGTDWRLASAGSSHIAAIKMDGTLWTWGYGFNGQLGTGSTASKSSPVQTTIGGNSWRRVAAGWASTFAIRDFTEI